MESDATGVDESVGQISKEPKSTSSQRAAQARKRRLGSQALPATRRSLLPPMDPSSPVLQCSFAEEKRMSSKLPQIGGLGCYRGEKPKCKTWGFLVLSSAMPLRNARSS